MTSETYDALDFSDGNGKMYLADTRSASWKRVAPDRVSISLNEPMRAPYRERCFRGHCILPFQAIRICTEWCLNGAILPDFTEDERVLI